MFICRIPFIIVAMERVQQTLFKQLEAVENLAKAGKMKRLWAYPFRYIYAFVFRKWIYPITRKGMIQQVRTFFDLPMHLVLPASTDIYLTGGKPHPSEIRLARLLIQQLQPGDTFVDIGAHFGYFSLLASVLVGETGGVYAFEASKSTFQLLQKNINHLVNIKIFNQAVSDTNENITFYQFPVMYSEYNSMEVGQFAKEGWFKKFKPEAIEIEAVTINQLVLQHKISPKIIKIDVEGAEDKVIAGAQEALQVIHPFIVLEYLEPSRQNEAHRKAAKLLQLAGYQAHSIDEKGELVLCKDIESYLAAQQLDSDNIVFVKD